MQTEVVGQPDTLPRSRARWMGGGLMVLFGIVPTLGLLVVYAPFALAATTTLAGMLAGGASTGFSALVGAALTAWILGGIAFVYGTRLVIRIIHRADDALVVRPQERRWVKCGLGLWVVVLGISSLWTQGGLGFIDAARSDMSTFVVLVAGLTGPVIVALRLPVWDMLPMNTGPTKVCPGCGVLVLETQGFCHACGDALPPGSASRT